MNGGSVLHEQEQDGEELANCCPSRKGLSAWPQVPIPDEPLLADTSLPFSSFVNQELFVTHKVPVRIEHVGKCTLALRYLLNSFLN